MAVPKLDCGWRVSPRYRGTPPGLREDALYLPASVAILREGSGAFLGAIREAERTRLSRRMTSGAAPLGRHVVTASASSSTPGSRHGKTTAVHQLNLARRRLSAAQTSKVDGCLRGVGEVQTKGHALSRTATLTVYNPLIWNGITAR